MRVLHVAPSYEPAWERGGVVRSLSALCKGVAMMGVDVHVYTTDSVKRSRLDVATDVQIDVNGVKVTYFHAQNTRFAYSKALAKALAQDISQFDIVHITSVWCYPGLMAGHFARKHCVPYVESPRGCLVPEAFQRKPLRNRVLWWLFEKRNFNGASAVHFTTSLERRLSTHLSISTPSFIVPNGFDVSEFQKTSEPGVAKARLGLPQGVPIVGFLGRLHQHKALDELVRAVHFVSRSFPRCHLLLAGPDDGFQEELETLVSTFEMENQVTFTGFVKGAERLDVLAACDVFALVSYSENFGNAAVEALAVGKPVLVSERVGLAADVLKYDVGRVVPVEVPAIAGELHALLSSPGLLTTMSARAQKMVDEVYSIESVAEAMLTAYEDINSARRSCYIEWSDV